MLSQALRISGKAEKKLQIINLSYPLTMLLEGDRLILLPLIILCLGVCFVRAVWEIEQARERRCSGRKT
jgi:hypothetical protein